MANAPQSLGPFAYRDYFRTGLQLVQIIPPILHHALSLRQVFGAVVSTPDFIPLTMGKLPLDHVRFEVASLVEDGRGHCPKAVARHFAFVPQPVKSKQHSVIANRFIAVSAGKNVSAAASDCPDFKQESQRLFGKGNEVLCLHLHATSGNNPERLIQIELRRQLRHTPQSPSASQGVPQGGRPLDAA